jgi:molybdate transport system ATP-binding protein
MSEQRLRARLVVRRGTFTLDLEIIAGPGEVVALLGPNGAGKTSALRALAGLTGMSGGGIDLGGEPLHTLPPERRPIGMVFQDYLLFPHLSAVDNVAFGPRCRGVGRREARVRAGDWLARVGLAEHAAKKPRALSGGQAQRVALARALAVRPRLLLLDEPLAALDTQTRATLRAELGERLRELGLPTLLVTHDYGDAAALADRIGVLVDGRIVQLGTAGELVAAPASPFVAEFTGVNFLRGTAGTGPDGLTEVRLADGTVVYSTDAASGHVGVVVFPWEVTLSRSAPVDSARNRLAGRIATVTPVGNRVRVGIGPLTAEVTAASAEQLHLRRGEYVVATFKAAGTRLVPLASRERD